MKYLLTFVFVVMILTPLAAIAQTPAAIEADLLKAFKKIDYNNRDNTEPNEVFAKKLFYYTQKFPFTINEDFAALKAGHLDINSSSDGLFRIYSWDTWTGGTMHFFESVFQYKVGTRTISILDTPKGDGDNRPNYRKIYTFKNNNKTYYICDYIIIESTKYLGEGLQVFAIINGVLNDDVKIIKTKSGLHSILSYEYDFGSVVDWQVRPSILFDSVTGTLSIPLVAVGGKVAHSFIVYKFNGQYFERVKN